MVKANLDIRKKAKASNIPFWMIADRLHISEVTFVRWLRHELPDSQKAKIFKIIQEISSKEQS